MHQRQHANAPHYQSPPQSASVTLQASIMGKADQELACSMFCSTPAMVLGLSTTACVSRDASCKACTPHDKAERQAAAVLHDSRLQCFSNKGRFSIVLLHLAVGLDLFLRRSMCATLDTRTAVDCSLSCCIDSALPRCWARGQLHVLADLYSLIGHYV